MSIYIKGMEKPSEGLQEIILLTHNKATVNSTRAWNGYEEFEAASIPPHGDLIDRDELVKYKDVVELEDFGYWTKSEEEVIWLEIVKLSEVVIPADPEEET